MKQWVQDGVVFCSYRNVAVGKAEEVQDQLKFKKVSV